MEVLLAPNELACVKAFGKVPLSCHTCAAVFYRPKNEVLKILKGNRTYTFDYCSRPCRPDSPKQVECKNCHKLFLKEARQIARTANNFCGRSCSARFHNRHKTSGTKISKLESWLKTKLVEAYPELAILFNDRTTIGLELDIFIPRLNLAFELNGLFHYEPIFGLDKLLKVQQRDKSKLAKCHEAGIDLCVLNVTDQLKFSETTSWKFLDTIVDIIEGRRKGFEPS